MDELMIQQALGEVTLRRRVCKDTTSYRGCTSSL